MDGEKTVFDTEKEAEDRLWYLQNLFLNRLCPVFQDTHKCEKCHSYNEGYLYSTKDSNKDFFRLFKPCCTSPLVTGTIEVENG